MCCCFRTSADLELGFLRFSDMQFDDSRVKRHEQPLGNTWETEHRIIKGKFAEAGYEVPEIVYW